MGNATHLSYPCSIQHKYPSMTFWLGTPQTPRAENAILGRAGGGGVAPLNRGHQFRRLGGFLTKNSWRKLLFLDEIGSLRC